jgi:type VI secretion system protein ImpL
VRDFKVAPFPNVERLTTGLAIISGPSSPLRALLKLVDDNTHLIKPAAEQQGAIDKAQQAVKDRIGKMFSAGAKAAGLPTSAPRGTKVTQHFADLHRYLEGPAGQAPIDRHLAMIAQVQQRLQSVGTGVGEVNPLEALVQSGSGDTIKALKQEAATLPPVLADLVNQVSERSASVAMGQARAQLAQVYDTDVVAKCNAMVTGRYPFQASSGTDVLLADFGRVFGSGGYFDAFFQKHLQPLVDTSRSPWRWRSGDAGSIGLSPSILRQFELVGRIREAFFRPGGQLPEVRFTVTADFLDAAATRGTLEIDGQSVDYRHGPVRAVPIVWPGPSPGTAAISFEDRAGGKPNIVMNGPWAMFRLLGKANINPQSDVRYVIGWSAGGHESRMVFEASSISNPLAADLLRQFSCGG